MQPVWRRPAVGNETGKCRGCRSPGTALFANAANQRFSPRVSRIGQLAHSRERILVTGGLLARFLYTVTQQLLPVRRQWVSADSAQSSKDALPGIRDDCVREFAVF